MRSDAGRLRVGDASIAYALDGPAGAPVVLLANSLMADLSMWEPNLPDLARAHRVLRYDMRGHGASAAPDGACTVPMLADDAAGLLDALGIAKVHVVGISLGGMVAQALALGHPRRVRSLVLCDTGSTLPEVGRRAWDDRIALAARDREAVIDATLERWFTPAFLQADAARRARWRAMLARTSAAGYAACAAAVRDVELAASLRAIDAPCLVVNGRQDTAWTVAQAEALRDAIRGARLAVIDDAAHIPNIEQPAAFTRAVLGFIDELE